MRHHDQPVDLFVAVIRKREHGPIIAVLPSAHFDAADDAVGSRRGRNLEAVAFGALALDHRGQIDGGGIAADIDGVERAGRPFRAKPAVTAASKKRREKDASNSLPPRCPPILLRAFAAVAWQAR